MRVNRLRRVLECVIGKVLPVLYDGLVLEQLINVVRTRAQPQDAIVTRTS